MNNIIEIFSYDFMIKALIVGTLISLCASLVGVSLVLRRNSMIGDGLSHVGFGAFSIATVLNIAPLEFALPIVMVTSFLILKLNQNSKVHGDSAIALLSASSLAWKQADTTPKRRSLNLRKKVFSVLVLKMRRSILKL